MIEASIHATSVVRAADVDSIVQHILLSNRPLVVRGFGGSGRTCIIECIIKRELLKDHFPLIVQSRISNSLSDAIVAIHNSVEKVVKDTQVLRSILDIGKYNSDIDDVNALLYKLKNDEYAQLFGARMCLLLDHADKLLASDDAERIDTMFRAHGIKTVYFISRATDLQLNKVINKWYHGIDKFDVMQMNDTQVKNYINMLGQKYCIKHSYSDSAALAVYNVSLGLHAIVDELCSNCCMQLQNRRVSIMRKVDEVIGVDDIWFMHSALKERYDEGYCGKIYKCCVGKSIQKHTILSELAQRVLADTWIGPISRNMKTTKNRIRQEREIFKMLVRYGVLERDIGDTYYCIDPAYFLYVSWL